MWLKPQHTFCRDLMNYYLFSSYTSRARTHKHIKFTHSSIEPEINVPISTETKIQMFFCRFFSLFFLFCFQHFNKKQQLMENRTPRARVLKIEIKYFECGMAVSRVASRDTTVLAQTDTFVSRYDCFLFTFA